MMMDVDYCFILTGNNSVTENRTSNQNEKTTNSRAMDRQRSKGTTEQSGEDD